MFWVSGSSSLPPVDSCSHPSSWLPLTSLDSVLVACPLCWELPNFCPSFPLHPPDFEDKSAENCIDFSFPQRLVSSSSSLVVLVVSPPSHSVSLSPLHSLSELPSSSGVPQPLPAPTIDPSFSLYSEELCSLCPCSPSCSEYPMMKTRFLW